MKRFFAFILGLTLSIPAFALATPVSWDYTTNLLQPLLSGRSAQIKGAYFTASSTATSTLPNLTTSDLAVTGKLYGAGSPGVNGYYLQSTGTGVQWASVTASGDGASNWLFDGTRLTPSTTVGIGVFASSTIGDGTATGGLTISGNSTTTGNLYVTGGITTATNVTNTFAGRLIVSNTLGIESSGKVTASSDLYTTASGADLWLGTATQSLSLASMRATGVTTLGTTTQSGTSMLTVGGDAWIGGNLTATGTLTVTGLTSALTLTGTSCTNQMVTGLSALGVATCETIDLTDTNITAGDALTITANDIDFDGGATPGGALGGTWASPTVDDDGHNHTGTTLSGIDISADTNLSADGTEIVLTGDALSLGNELIFTNATTTNLRVTTSFGLPYGASQTSAFNGELVVDSTSGQVKVMANSVEKVLGNGNFYPAFTYATTTAWTGTTTIPLGTAYVAETWNGVQCFTDAGTLVTRFGDGTNWTNVNNSSTTVGTTVFTANNTFTAGEKRYVEVGTPATSPTKISCTISKSLTAD